MLNALYSCKADFVLTKLIFDGVTPHSTHPTPSFAFLAFLCIISEL